MHLKLRDSLIFDSTSLHNQFYLTYFYFSRSVAFHWNSAVYETNWLVVKTCGFIPFTYSIHLWSNFCNLTKMKVSILLNASVKIMLLFFFSLLKVHLQVRGFSVFIDVEKLEAGKFEEKLISSVQRARNFILVLSANALDKCMGDTGMKDWVHKVSNDSAFLINAWGPNLVINLEISRLVQVMSSLVASGALGAQKTLKCAGQWASNTRVGMYCLYHYKLTYKTGFWSKRYSNTFNSENSVCISKIWFQHMKMVSITNEHLPFAAFI